jgi:filamentous hemagglutinin
MTQASWRNSMLFPGIVDANNQVLSNISAGRLGGTRVDLDKICGDDYARCARVSNPDGTFAKNSDGTYVLATNDKGQYIFKGDGQGKHDTWGQFLATEAGQSMFGKTGGLQGWLPGTMFGKSYQPGDLINTIVEAFAGVHDFIGGQLPGFYDSQGNAKQGMSNSEKATFSIWSGVAVPIAAPFAASLGTSPGAWNAFSALVK